MFKQVTKAPKEISSNVSCRSSWHHYFRNELLIMRAVNGRLSVQNACILSGILGVALNWRETNSLVSSKIDTFVAFNQIIELQVFLTMNQSSLLALK
jgi:hypothetical protein